MNATLDDLTQVVDLFKSMTERMDRQDRNIQALGAQITNLDRAVTVAEDHLDERIDRLQTKINQKPDRYA